MAGPTLATLALVLSAASASPKLVVVELDAPPTMIGLAAQVTKGVMEEAGRTKQAYITPDEVRGKLGGKAYAELVACWNKPPCVAQALSVFPDAQRAVVGSLNKDEKSYLLHLVLLDLKTMEPITEVDRAILIASRRFQHDVQGAIGPFLRGEKDPKGTLEVSCNARDAQVTVDGEFIGVCPVKLQLKPGKHEVKVERPKYLPVTRLVGVEPNQTTKEEIRLILKPGEKPDEEELPGFKPEGGVAKSEAPGYTPSAQVWIVGAVAVVGLGTAAYFAITESSTERNLKEGYNPMTHVYEGTRAQALALQRDALLANVLWGVGGAAAIVTAILIYFDVKSQSAVQVTPTAGPGGAGVLLRGSF